MSVFKVYAASPRFATPATAAAARGAANAAFAELSPAGGGAVEVGVSPHAQGQVVASRCSNRSNSGSVISSLASAAASSRRAAL